MEMSLLTIKFWQNANSCKFQVENVNFVGYLLVGTWYLNLSVRSLTFYFQLLHRDEVRSDVWGKSWCWWVFDALIYMLVLANWYHTNQTVFLWIIQTLHKLWVMEWNLTYYSRIPIYSREDALVTVNTLG